MQYVLSSIILIILYLICQEEAMISPQYCPASPVQLRATSEIQIFSSPGYDSGLYPNNLDCSWLITTQNARRRIYLRIDDSEFDAPLFSVCDDYCAVYDGNNDISTEISRWCGKKRPYGFISSSDALYIVFHTDDRFQSRGVKFLFAEYEVPGCPTGWLVNRSLRTCYTLQTTSTGLTWAEAQTECAAQKSNLLTVTSQQEYAYITETFTRNATIFWIGYSDATDERTFRSIDTNERIWPDQFPVFPKRHDREDCVYMNPYSYEGIAYEVASCVNKFSYVCKMRQDGQTIPFMADIQTIRKGLMEYSRASIQWPIIILCIIIIAASLTALWCVYNKFQERRSKKRVGNIEDAGRLVTVHSQQEQQQPKETSKTYNEQQNDLITRTSHVVELYPTNANTLTTDQKRAADHVHRFLETFERDLEGNCDSPRTSEQLHELDNFETLVPKAVLESDVEQNTKMPNATDGYPNTENIQETSTKPKQKYQKAYKSTEQLRQTTATNYPLTNPYLHQHRSILDRRSSLFGRPRVALLENTSAISLDEFWSGTS